MSITAANVITLVRESVKDTKEDYRFEDAELLRAIDEVQREMLYERPQLRLQADGSYVAITAVSTTGTVLLVGNELLQAMASAVCSKLFVKDGEDDQNLGLAGVHKQVYNSEV